MDDSRQTQLDIELGQDEGDLLYLYDDANGARIIRGYTVKGTPTFGVGVNATFIYPEERDFCLHFREQKADSALRVALPWYAALDEVRQDALIDLYYNVPGFVHWEHFTGFAATGDWQNAAAELENTHPWIDEVKSRGLRIAAILRTGHVVSG